MARYKTCDKCTRKICEKTGEMCKAMDNWLKLNVDFAQQEKLMTREELKSYDFFVQGVDNKGDMEEK